MDFYFEEVLPIREAVTAYFESVEFGRLLKSCQSTYFVEHYFSCLKEHCIGGKCIRAYLVDLGYRLKTGLERRLQIEAPASYEIFEAGILAHDDIIDQSSTRRRKPSMYVALGGDHVGVSRGICVGDFALLLCNLILGTCSFSEKILLRAFRHQNTMFSYTISGQLLDIDLSARREYTEAEVLEMYRLKTSCYTIAGPLILGAIFGEASDEFIRFLWFLGMDLGIAFQIHDDILGVFGDETIIGKSITCDSVEGKKSVLTTYFDRNCTESERNLFYSYYGNHSLAVSDMEIIQHLLKETGSLEYAQRMARFYEERALKLLENTELTAEKQTLLIDFCKYLAQRQL